MTPGELERPESVSISAVAEAIKTAMPDLDANDQQIATAIHRLMSRGAPVEPAAVAKAVGVAADQVKAKLDSWPGVFRDDDGLVVGFWGHSVQKLDPEYRLIFQGKTTYAWCALDTLFIPGILGSSVRVEASDPVSGEAVSLVVDRDGVHEVSPVNVWVSMVIPDGPFGYDVIESFCHRVLFFASEETGRRWSAEHNGTTLMPLEKAFELGRALTERIVRDRAATS